MKDYGVFAREILSLSRISSNIVIKTISNDVFEIKNLKYKVIQENHLVIIDNEKDTIIPLSQIASIVAFKDL